MLQQQEPLSLSDSAKQRVRSILQKRGDSNLLLRVNIVPGGCSGLSYQMTLDSNFNDSDHIFRFDDVGVVVATSILPDVAGSVIDFEESLLASQFVVKNPNATKSCNCGTSFQTATNKGKIKQC